MAKFYSISIINEYAFILYLEEKNGLLIVLESFEIEISELALFVKNKKNLYISVEQAFEFSENIKVPIAIAKSNNVRNYLFYKIKEANPNIDILFNFKKIPKQNDEENIIYSVEVVDEKAYIASLDFVKDLSSIKSATTNKFALLSLANRCINDDHYICVYTNARTVLVLAVEQKELIFSRAISIDVSDPQTLQMHIAENITQTLSYIANQFRDIKFNTLALSGSIALDDVIPQHIAMLNNLNISILYPNSFVQNIDAEESQTQILPLGTSLVAKSNQFLPKVILGIRQFHFVSALFLALSSIILLVMCYFTLNAYNKYTDLANEKKVLESRYLNLLSHTKMLSQKELTTYINHIIMVKKYLQNTPVDSILLIKPLIEMDKPIEFEYKNEDGIISFKAIFEKQFKELKNLYTFEKEFNKRFEKIKNIVKIEKKIATDYEQLIFKANVYTLKNNAGSKSRGRRR